MSSFISNPKDLLVSGIDPGFTFLVDNSAYFGENGAIVIFEQRYMKDMTANLAVGDHALAVKYLCILFSALTYCSEGNLIMKLRILPLLFTITKWMKKVTHSVSLERHAISSGELHILMSIAVKVLQMLKKMKLFTLCEKMSDGVRSDLVIIFLYIKKLSDEESQGIVYSSLVDPGPDNLMLIMAESMLYELCMDGILKLPSPVISKDEDLVSIFPEMKSKNKDVFILPCAPAIKERVWRYAMHHEKTKNLDIARVVSQLFRSIGRYEEALHVANRVGNLDQIRKAS